MTDNILDTLTNAEDAVEAIIFFEPANAVHCFKVVMRDIDAEETVGVVRCLSLAQAETKAREFVTGVKA